MSNCNCIGGRVYGVPVTPTPKVQDCLCINDLRVGCDNGPAPCGDTMTINLAEYNDVTASECDVVYTLKSFDSTAFSSVTLTESGSLVITTSNSFKKYEEFKIVYKVDSPCSVLSDQATVYICLKDLCKNNTCEGTCNQCTGECNPVDPEVALENYPPNNEIGIA